MIEAALKAQEERRQEKVATSLIPAYCNCGRKLRTDSGRKCYECARKRS